MTDTRLYVFLAEGESDITVTGPSDYVTEMGPWVCVECPNGITNEMNVMQMRDHVTIFHKERGAVLWKHFVETIKEVSAYWVAKLAKEKANA